MFLSFFCILGVVVAVEEAVVMAAVVAVVVEVAVMGEEAEAHLQEELIIESL